MAALADALTKYKKKGKLKFGGKMAKPFQKKGAMAEPEEDEDEKKMGKQAGMAMMFQKKKKR